MEEDGLALKYASDTLKNNSRIVRLAVHNNGLALRYASNKLRDNQDIVEWAVKQNGRSIKYASTRLKKNKDILELKESFSLQKQMGSEIAEAASINAFMFRLIQLLKVQKYRDLIISFLKKYELDDKIQTYLKSKKQD